MTSLRRARLEDMQEARLHMITKTKNSHRMQEPHALETWKGDLWTRADVKQRLLENPGACLLLLDDFIIDATGYMREHVGA